METIYIKNKKFNKLPDEICAAIGNFDGVHIGHQQLVKECKKHNLKSGVITFYPHPSIFLKKIPNYPLLTPIEEKKKVFESLGIDYLIIIEFNNDMALMPKEEFIKCLKELNIKSLVAGYDFTFGKMAEGDIRDLADNFIFYEVKKYIYDGIRVSTTYIRELLDSGNIIEANKLLGRHYSISGIVEYGNQKGRLIGFPTANIDYKNYFLPKGGVYSVSVSLNGKTITAPVFSESKGKISEGNTDSYAFWVKSGSELIIEGDGEIIARPANYSMAVWANGGKVIIKGGKFYNNGNNSDLIYASNDALVEIYGGEFHANKNDGAEGTKNPYPALNIKDAHRKTAKIIVYGGKFFGFDPANNVSEGSNTNFVADGYKSMEIEPGVWEVMPA
jgi:riboflavin kinase/FMN adenylyltransferase